LFGEIAALVILFAAAFAIDHATARFRCKDCGHEMRLQERGRACTSAIEANSPLQSRRPPGATEL
jgi:Zn finger protein HypA/HybF involved in hydrogenase expression